MISEIRLINYKKFLCEKIPLEPITVFIGPNGAGKGFADAVLVLVDNDGDTRFKFPHGKRCGNCRECEAWNTLEEIQQLHWAQPFAKGAAILFQAAETLLLSARSGFTPQIEESLYSKALKIRLYSRQPDNITEAFKEELEKTEASFILP